MTPTDNATPRPTAADFLPLTIEGGMILTTKRNGIGQRYGIAQTSGELVPAAPIADFYWGDIEGDSAKAVKDLFALIVRAVNERQGLIDALSVLLCAHTCGKHEREAGKRLDETNPRDFDAAAVNEAVAALATARDEA